MIKVKSVIVNFIIIIVFTALYVALTERFTLINAAIGFGVALIVLLLTNKVFLSVRYQTAFTLNAWYIVYVAYLFYIILKSAVHSLVYIFSKDISINLITYQTSLKDDNLKGMLANTITLTPGTVTADIKEDAIEVMKLCKRCTLDQTTGFVKIEKILKRMERTEDA